MPKNEILRKYNNSEDIATAYWNNGVSLANKYEDDIRKVDSTRFKTKNYRMINDIELEAEQKLRFALWSFKNAREIHAAKETKISCDEEISYRETQHELVRKQTHQNAVKEYQIPVPEGLNTGNNTIDSHAGQLISSDELSEEVSRKFRGFFENVVSGKSIDCELTGASLKDRPKNSKAYKKHVLKLKANRYKKHDLFSQALSTAEQVQFTRKVTTLNNN